MDSITEYIQYIYGLERKGIKYDLKKIAQLLKETGNPHNSQNYIHIAGTNGKGGTASFLASILMEHGLKTGLFTSPHILRFNERIRINGKSIPNSYIKSYLQTNFKLIKKIKASFFEINTGLALKYFSDKHADVSVIETGLGGRLDATNIIIPQLLIITQLGVEHTDMLGTTLQKIATEKIGIVKPNIDVIVSDNHSELHRLFLNKIDNTRLHFMDDLIKSSSFDQTNLHNNSRIEFKEYDIKFKFNCPLPGKYHYRNVLTAIYSSLNYLSTHGIKTDISKIRKGIENVVNNTGYHCRFERIKSNGLTYILDVAHNPDAVRNSLDNLKFTRVDTIIFALMNDKNYKLMVNELVGVCDRIIFTRPNSNRSQDPKILFDYAVKISNLNKIETVIKEYFCVYDVKDAIRLSRNLVVKNKRILVIGSFFLVSEAIKALKLQKFLN